MDLSIRGFGGGGREGAGGDRICRMWRVRRERSLFCLLINTGSGFV